MRFAILVLAAGVLLIAGCGDTETATVTERETVVKEPPPETVERTVTERTSRRPKPKPAPAPAPAPAAESSSGIEVPNVVGGDHQLAQDTMQAAGLYSLDEEDATGEGRLLLWDRNWTVVRQEPAAGTVVSEDTTITLYSKPDDE